MIDRKEVKRIITELQANDYITNKQEAIKKAIKELCKLQPKNQKVIAEGKVTTQGLYVGDNPIDICLYNLMGKKGKLIWEED